MATPKTLLVSIHDAAPHHLQRLQLAEQLLMELGIAKAAVLFIPDYHGHGPSSNDGEFVVWCNKERQINFSWFLHGYSHLEERSDKKQSVPGLSRWLKRQFLTDNEAEFLALDCLESHFRLEKAKDIFSKVLPGVNPAGFIAPAWLFNKGLFSVLAEMELALTESHKGIYHIEKKKEYICPVISWATRTLFYEYGSRLINPFLLHFWRNRVCLRIALHPMDFDYPKTVKNIRHVLLSALRDRTVVSYNSIYKEV
jgi:predicted deacetylase